MNPEPALGGGLRRAVGAKSAPTQLRRGLPARVRRAVLERDWHTCRWCGFRAGRFQEIAVLDGAGRDVDRLATACVFCHQSHHVDWLPSMRSGVFLWLPEVDQIQLHHLARELYVFRLARGSAATNARRALDHLMTRKADAAERLGTEDAGEVVALLERLRQNEDAGLAKRLEGIRLFPLDRRILTEGDIEFNQFPIILAYWRSPQGPFHDIDTQPLIDSYLRDIVGETAVESASSTEDEPSSISAAEPTDPAAEPRPRTAGARVDLGYEWTPVLSDLPTLLDSVPVIDGALHADPDTTHIEWTRLPWYDDVALVRLTDETWPMEDFAAYFLSFRGNVFRLNGSSAAIHEVNAKAGIRLTEANVLEYVRFFCFFVRGDEGPFYVAESSDRLILPDDLDGEARATIENSLRPALLNRRDERGFFLCSGLVFYSNVLFNVEFAVEPKGIVNMLNDDPVAADLPVRVRAPIVYGRY